MKIIVARHFFLRFRLFLLAFWNLCHTKLLFIIKFSVFTERIVFFLHAVFYTLIFRFCFFFARKLANIIFVVPLYAWFGIICSSSKIERKKFNACGPDFMISDSSGKRGGAQKSIEKLTLSLLFMTMTWTNEEKIYTETTEWRKKKDRDDKQMRLLPSVCVFFAFLIIAFFQHLPNYRVELNKSTWLLVDDSFRVFRVVRVELLLCDSITIHSYKFSLFINFVFSFYFHLKLNLWRNKVN